MQNQRFNNRAARGSAMLTSMIIIGVLALVTAGMMAMSMQQPFNVRKTRDQLRAQAIAEAGANIAYAMLSTNFALKDNASAFPETTYRGGKYDVTVSSLSATAAVLTSVGICNAATSTVAMDVVNSTTNPPTGTRPPATGLFLYALASGTKIDGGTSNAGDGINGNVKAPVISDSKNKITGTKTIGAVNVANLVDLTPYLNYAIANGTKLSGYQTFQDYVAPGGIVWVDGDITLKGNVTGCFIATGNITANGGYTQTSVGNYPALISQNGNISINNSYSEGLIYAPQGSVYLGGNASIHGTVIAAQTISFSGCAEVYQNSTPVAPVIVDPATLYNVTIGAWRE